MPYAVNESRYAKRVTARWNTATLALAWCLKNPNVSTVITGASKVAQVTENMKALDVLPKLNADVLDRIEQILQNKPELVGDFR